MSNMSVQPQQPIQPVTTSSPVPPSRPELKTPDSLFKPFDQQDQSHAVSPPAGGATQTVPLFDENTSPPSQAVSPEDLQWASQIEQQAAGGYEATPEEVARYQNILQSLQAQQQQQATAAGIPPEDMQWASELEAKASQGGQVTPEETERYQAILAKLQAAAPAAPVQSASAPTPQPGGDAAAAVSHLEPVVDPGSKPPIDLGVKFQELETLLGQKKYMIFGEYTQPEQIRATGVQIWLDGNLDDRLKLAQLLVDNGQSEVLGRVMGHEETNVLEIAELMSKEGFPVKDYMNALDDNEAFLVLNSLSSVAAMGEASSVKVIEQVIDGYDRIWDREAPFERLKNHHQSQGTWETIPADLRQKIETLLK